VTVTTSYSLTSRPKVKSAASSPKWTLPLPRSLRARWATFRTDHLVTLNGKQRGNTLHLHGVQSIGRAFGNYHYDATVTPTHFSMRYDSRYDSGTMELDKVRP
jgi:hypothetical protein